MSANSKTQESPSTSAKMFGFIKRKERANVVKMLTQEEFSLGLVDSVSGRFVALYTYNMFNYCIMDHSSITSAG